MKRTLVLLGLPVFLVFVWVTGESRAPDATAEVSIDTDRVVEVRGVVISRLSEVGARKVAETTDYVDEGSSDLTFRVAPDRLERALNELALVGGSVTEQQVELEQFTADAGDLAQGLDDLDGCLDVVASNIGTDSEALASGLDTCREQLATATGRAEARPEATRSALLTVHLNQPSTRSIGLTVSVGLLSILLAVMAYLTIRSTRHDHVYDITEKGQPTHTEDLYHRRN